MHLIRTEYREDVPIILRCDSGFFDEKNFAAFDAVGGASDIFWERCDNGHQLWDFMEFGFRCDKWKRFHRAVHTRPFYEDGLCLR